ncbi:MAG: 4-(cytidine 5'-diphospho)-2-C-methyl-D-erythritol kinase [Bacteroidaceae bacterium]|nr:4-(cytidine 5'-diphospho)-2-C-methyl-D-erythritol kinase [Bacteroidaceae bacterium]
MIVYPNAKINLGLNVVGRRPDGYHNIETIFYPIPLQDALEVQELAEHPESTPNEEKPALTTTIDRHRFRQSGAPLDCDPEQNLVLRTLHLLEQDFEFPPLDIYLYKHIPSGAGLGGGSSDAAFMMRLLNEKFHLGLSDEEQMRRLATLGADCPFFVLNRPSFATGIGDNLTPIDLDLSGWHIVLVKPDIHVNTGEAYAGVTPQEPLMSLDYIASRPVSEWETLMHNDFEPSVFSHHPEIAGIKDRLLDLGATYAAMSGSGSAVYALFQNHLEHIEEKFPNYYVRQRNL